MLKKSQTSLITGRFNSSNEQDVEKLLEIVMQGLGLQKLPDTNKANISQSEYETKYMQYLTRVRKQKQLELMQENQINNLNDYYFPKLFNSILHNSSYALALKQRRKKRSLFAESANANIVFVRFSLKDDEYESSDDIEEANLRLMIVYNPKIMNSIRKISKNDPNSHLHWIHSRDKQNSSIDHSKHILNIKVYQLIEPHGKIWLDSRKVEIEENENLNHRWIEFDVTKAVETWVNGEQENLGLEIQCDKCHLYGVKIIDDSYPDAFENKYDANRLNTKKDIQDFNPILNIIGRIGGVRREKRSHQYHPNSNSGLSALNNGRKKRKTECYEGNTRCCRHSMEVVFKEIKDFSFIIQPKIFDAGYCRGRCPPRYNPAHHHAVLQSLIWKKDRNKAPRPCCAPSKLVELEVLHIDENDSTKLKVSRWNDMKVIECACS